MSNAMRRRAAQITATMLLTVILVVLPGADAALAAAPTISVMSMVAVTRRSAPHQLRDETEADEEEDDACGHRE